MRMRIILNSQHFCVLVRMYYFLCVKESKPKNAYKTDPLQVSGGL